MTMRSSRVVRSLSLLIAIGGLCLPSTDAVAQRRGAAAISGEIISSTSPLNATQRQEIEDFARSKIARLADGDPAEIVDARDALIIPADDINATALFVRVYAESILPSITPTIDGKDALRAENALRVAAFLRTPEAGGLLVETLDAGRIEDAGRRLVAAGVIPIAVKDVKCSGISSAVLVSMARGISESLATESDWMVAFEELRALQVIALSPKLTKANRAQIRTMQFDAFATLSKRIESSAEPSPLIFAVHRAILSLRDRLDTNDLASDVDPKVLAGSLEAMLINVAGAAIRQWNGLDDDDSLFSAYEGTLRVGNQLLIYLDESSAAKIEPLARTITLAFQSPAGSAERRDAKARLEAAFAKVL